jgi:hypothetical protein
MELVYALVILASAIVIIIILQKSNKLREADLKGEISRLSEDKESLRKEQLGYVREVAELKK